MAGRGSPRQVSPAGWQFANYNLRSRNVGGDLSDVQERAPQVSALDHRSSGVPVYNAPLNPAQAKKTSGGSIALSRKTTSFLSGRLQSEEVECTLLEELANLDNEEEIIQEKAEKIAEEITDLECKL